LARAVVGEAAVDYFAACSVADFVEVYVGRGAARIRSCFAQARQQAKDQHAHNVQLRVIDTTPWYVMRSVDSSLVAQDSTDIFLDF
jgi:hypothetical protein